MSVHTYLRKSLRPHSPAFFFMESHDLRTRASCSSVKLLMMIKLLDKKWVCEFPYWICMVLRIHCVYIVLWLKCLTFHGDGEPFLVAQKRKFEQVEIKFNATRCGRYESNGKYWWKWKPGACLYGDWRLNMVFDCFCGL